MKKGTCTGCGAAVFEAYDGTWRRLYVHPTVTMTPCPAGGTHQG